MGIEAKHTLHCDWCDVQPDPDQVFGSYEEAYAEMQRVSRFEGWLLRTKSSTIQFGCPECVADGRFR